MTDLEKQKVAVLRSEGKSYGAIAEELNVSINSVKTFCRRSHLAGSRATENISETEQKTDLTERGNRVISTGTETPKALEKTGVSLTHPTCRVKVTFADEDDENAIPDVLGMLMSSMLRKGCQ